MSGCNDSTRALSSASPASTETATFFALPRTRAPSVRAVSKEMLRGDGGKKTKPTISAPASSATSSDSGVERPQIFTISDMVSAVLEHFVERDLFEKPASTFSDHALSAALLHGSACLVSPRP